MTTTNCYQGMGDDQNPSSRVLRPPGGGSSDIFGTGSVAHNENKTNRQLNQSSNIFGGAEAAGEDQQGYKHINRKPQHSSQSAIFGEDKSPSANAADLKKKNQEAVNGIKHHPETKTKSEEFPAYDRSVYVAQMTPQRRNIQQVSSYNPITNESYYGQGEEQQQDQFNKRSGQNANRNSSYNVITNELYENNSEPSPAKPVGKRVLSTSSEEGTYNPITGQLIGNKSDQQQKNSSRVLNPPGGKSSGIF